MNKGEILWIIHLIYMMYFKHMTDVKQGEDIRKILVETSDFVPAYSLAYTVDEHKRPIFLEK